MSTPSGEPPYPGSQPNQPGYDPNQGQPQAQPGYGAEQGHPGQQQGYPGQQAYPAQEYGQGQPPAGYGGAPLQPRNGLGIAALVLGIVSILAAITLIGVILGIPLGLLALILGIVGVRRVGKGVATNKGVSIAGIVTGLLGLIASVAIVALGAAFFVNSGGGDLVKCVQQAAGDQARTLQCQQQYQQQVQNGVSGNGY